MATPVIAFSQLAAELEAEGLTPDNSERVAAELAKTFSVESDEVAIMKVAKGNLAFVFPTKLANVGSIPLNTSTSVAARTANSKRAEAINNFAQTKHASVFESMIGPPAHDPDHPGHKEEKHTHIIQKLMSVPVVGPSGVLGVIQVCRKGKSAPEAGVDFVPGDLQRLVQIASSLARCFN